MWFLQLLIGPVADVFKTVFGKVEDTVLGKYKVDGQVDIAVIQALTVLAQAQADLLKNKWIVALQVLFGVPTALYYGKCLVYDKMLGLGHTDPLTGDIETWALWIVGFLFLHSAISQLGRR